MKQGAVFSDGLHVFAIFEFLKKRLLSPVFAHTKGGRRRMEMKGYSFALTMGLGAAVGAVCQAASKIAQ